VCFAARVQCAHAVALPARISLRLPVEHPEAMLAQRLVLLCKSASMARAAVLWVQSMPTSVTMTGLA
jgi:hypothetical protein